MLVARGSKKRDIHREPLSMTRQHAGLGAVCLALLLAQICAARPVAPTDYLPWNQVWESAWIAGTTALASPGNYGTLGVGTNETFPASRTLTQNWSFIDPDTGEPSLYMYGGGSAETMINGITTSLARQDMWHYNVTSGIWTWVSGSAAGTPLVAGTPARRRGAATWTAGQYLYLYGGYTTASVAPGDLWRFDTRAASWTLVRTESNVADCATHVLGSRNWPSIWSIPIDPSEAGGVYGASDIWLYGGYIQNPAATVRTNNIWHWNATLERFLCVQQYPTENQTLVALNDFDSASPEDCYPSTRVLKTGSGLANDENPQFGVADVAWVYNRTLLFLMQQRNVVNGFVPVMMAYAIDKNRWAPTELLSLLPDFPFNVSSTGEANPSYLGQGWTEYNVAAAGGESLLYAAMQVRQQDKWTRQLVWAYSYRNRTFYSIPGRLVTGPGTGGTGATAPTYGVRGVFARDNYAGSRRLAPIWQFRLPYSLPSQYREGAERIYIGFGIQSTGTSGRFGDLWALRPVNGLATPPPPAFAENFAWQCVAPNGVCEAGPLASGNYGNLSVPSAGSYPPPRLMAHTWTYVPPDGSASVLYVHGGYTARSAPGALFVYADMWKFNTAERTWTWIGGPDTGTTVPCCGNADPEAGVVWPGARYAGQTWVLGERLYLYGGNEPGSLALSDIWYYDVGTQNWTRVYNISNEACNPDSGIVGRRMQAAVWTVPRSSASGELDVYVYGGSEGSALVVPPPATYNMWKWNASRQYFDLVAAYPGPQVNTPFRNFSAEIPASATAPFRLGVSWVYNDSMLLYLPLRSDTMYGYSIETNRWAPVSQRAISGPVYDGPLATPGVLSAVPAVAVVARTSVPPLAGAWTDYALLASKEPAIVWMGTANITTAALDNNIIVVRYNMWIYEYLSDTYTWVDGTREHPVPATLDGTMSPTGRPNPGARVGCAVFDGENVVRRALAKTRSPTVYIGLGTTTGTPDLVGEAGIWPGIGVASGFNPVPFGGYSDVWQYRPSVPVQPTGPSIGAIVAIALVSIVVGIALIYTVVYLVYRAAQAPSQWIRMETM